MAYPNDSWCGRKGYEHAWMHLMDAQVKIDANKSCMEEFLLDEQFGMEKSCLSYGGTMHKALEATCRTDTRAEVEATALHYLPCRD